MDFFFITQKTEFSRTSWFRCSSYSRSRKHWERYIHIYCVHYLSSSLAWTGATLESPVKITLNRFRGQSFFSLLLLLLLLLLFHKYMGLQTSYIIIVVIITVYFLDYYYSISICDCRLFRFLLLLLLMQTLQIIITIYYYCYYYSTPRPVSFLSRIHREAVIAGVISTHTEPQAE